jgi:hypothetical protein
LTQIKVEFAVPKNYRYAMRRLFIALLLLGSLSALASDAVSGRVVKVLPLLLDLSGHDAVTPSLFDRDAYQAWLRLNTNQISALRFDVWCKTANADKTKLKLRVELRGVGENNLPRVAVLEKAAATGFFHRWTSLTLDGADYKNLGALVAWRATLWSGDQMLSEQKSFLW